jgi:uncharacterized protein (DUF2336 family)
MMPAAQPLIAELEAALARASPSWRSMTLRRLTDLFMVDAGSFSDDQIAVFDDVISRLLDNTDRRALADLSKRLAELERAPANVVATLARHSDISVAGPVLERSNILSDAILIEAVDKARRDPALLSAIVTRPQLSEAVTEVLIRRGTPAIARKVLDHAGARISEASFARLVTSLDNDKELAAVIAKHPDLPAELRPWIDMTLAS